MLIAIAGAFIGVTAHFGFAGWALPSVDTMLLVSVGLGGLLAGAGRAASARRIIGAELERE